MDSLPPESEDYAPPGLVYEEISDPYLNTFSTMQEVVVGPVTDRWGTLITALIPLIDPQTGTLIAVLGMDVDAASWNKDIIINCFIPFTIMLFIMFFILVLALREQLIIARQESEVWFRHLVADLPKIAVRGYNGDRNVIYWNRASEKLYGYSEKEAMGKKLEDLIIPIAIQDLIFLNRSQLNRSIT